MYWRNEKEMTARLKPLLLFGLVIILGSFLWAFQKQTDGNLEPYQPSKLLLEGELLDASVEDVLVELDDDLPLHYLSEIDKDSARMGEELVRFGEIIR